MSEDSTGQPEVSVVIGFKDWGLERLMLSIRSIHDSLGAVPHEVIISDYGSEDTESVALAAERVGARHEIVPTNGEWSRSRALNAGVRAARGEILLATDADMLFSPSSLHKVVAQLHQQPHEIVILQCRDLPVGFSHEVVSEVGFDWTRFASIGQIRPRWGMGGLVAVRRDLWGRVRGWDERMHTYGGEDVDFAKRAQKAGARINWLDEPGVAMYHIWHPSSGASASRSAEAIAAIAENRRIHTEDATFARNRVSPRYLPNDLPPLVSILVDSGTDEQALRATLTCLAGQTVEDLEIIVHGDAPLPLSDDRLRRAGTDRPRGTFLASARAGDVWAADRLEKLLELWEPGAGLISDAPSARLLGRDGEVLSPRATLKAVLPEAGAAIVRTALVEHETLEPARWTSIVHDVAASGARWIVSPSSRRVRTTNLETDEISAVQRASEARELTTVLARCGLQPPVVAQGVLAPLGELAEAVLGGRTLDLRVEWSCAGRSNDRMPETETRWQRSVVETPGGGVLHSSCTARGLDPADAVVALRAARAAGADLVALSEASDAVIPSTEEALRLLVNSSESAHAPSLVAHPWIVIDVDRVPLDGGRDSGAVASALRSSSAWTVVLERVVKTPGSAHSWVLARHRSSVLDDALLDASRVDRHGVEAVHIVSPESTTGRQEVTL